MDSQFIAFNGHQCLHRGTLLAVAEHAHKLTSKDPSALVHTFDLSSGRLIDLPVSGSWQEAQEWISENLSWALPKPATRGRPKLGVVSREVTLLPRQWQWLAEQPGGASATLRKLIDAAAKDPEAERRAQQDATYRLASALAGDLPHYEELIRALYAAEQDKFLTCCQLWPEDIRLVLLELADPIWT